MSKQRPYRLLFTLGCLAFSFLFYLDIPKLVHKPQDFLSSIATQIDIKAPETFGKTHFIIGYPHTKHKKKTLSENVLSDQIADPTCSAYFAPDDNVLDILLQLIGQEQQSICIAAFTFTDRKIADALISAHQRSIPIYLVTDSTGINDRYNKIIDLAEHGIEIYVYNYQQKGRKPGLMHNKFAIFGKNVADKALIWTGSCNFTRAANQDNQENVVLLDDPILVKKFSMQFDRLKERSSRYFIKKKQGKRTVHIEYQDNE